MIGERQEPKSEPLDAVTTHKIVESNDQDQARVMSIGSYAKTKGGLNYFLKHLY